MIRALAIFCFLISALEGRAFIFSSGGGDALNSQHADNIDNANGTNVYLRGFFTTSVITGPEDTPIDDADGFSLNIFGGYDPVSGNAGNLNLFGGGSAADIAGSVNIIGGKSPNIGGDVNLHGGFGGNGYGSVNITGNFNINGQPFFWGITTNLVAPNGVTYVFSNGILLTVTAAGSGGPTNLVAYWSMDETSGTRYDGSTNHNDLVEAVGPVAATDGVTNSAALFGSGDANYPNNYLTLANPIVGMDLNADWTFNFWFNLGSDYGGFDGLVRLTDSSGVNFFFLGNNNDNSLFMIVGDYSVNILPAGTATDLAGQWVQLNVSYVAGTGDLTFSTNGVVFATGNNSYYFGQSLADFEIGNQQESAEAHAAIDEFYIWQTATP